MTKNKYFKQCSVPNCYKPVFQHNLCKKHEGERRAQKRLHRIYLTFNAYGTPFFECARGCGMEIPVGSKCTSKGLCSNCQIQVRRAFVSLLYESPRKTSKEKSQ